MARWPPSWSPYSRSTIHSVAVLHRLPGRRVARVGQVPDRPLPESDVAHGDVHVPGLHRRTRPAVASARWAAAPGWSSAASRAARRSRCPRCAATAKSRSRCRGAPAVPSPPPISAAAAPPGTRTHLLSPKFTLSGSSLSFDGISSGRKLVSNDRSAARAVRLPDRTAENVASASTSVPSAVPRSATVAQVSALTRSPKSRGHPGHQGHQRSWTAARKYLSYRSLIASRVG